METVKVLFKDGVFVPLEEKDIPEGSEGIVVFIPKVERRKRPAWWNSLQVEERKKEALLRFSEMVSKKVTVNDVKVVAGENSFEVFVLAYDELNVLRPVMEIALKIYEEMGVYLPVQVISERRLNRWREQGSKLFESITKGVSLR
jgi:predicted DNA-binding antitoxin AbrB/MazE fold protein